MDLETLRKALLVRRGEWTALAGAAGIHRKSIERLCLQPGYMPRYSTFLSLWKVTFESQLEAA